MRTGDDFTNPVGGEFDMAPAVLAGTLEMRLGFWHGLRPIYDTAGLLNTENLGDWRRVGAARRFRAAGSARQIGNYQRPRLKLTKRPTRASHPRTSNSRRSRRRMEGRGPILDAEGFVAALSPFRGTTFSLGSVSQVSIGNVREFILIQSTTPTRCLRYT